MKISTITLLFLNLTLAAATKIKTLKQLLTGDFDDYTNSETNKETDPNYILESKLQSDAIIPISSSGPVGNYKGST